MSDIMNQAATMLFSRETGRVANVKFFLGSRREITADDLARELLRAEEQVAAGRAVRLEDVDGDLND